MILLLGGAQAFCGFYVGGADQELYNDATVVVMMREGTKTVLSMQNTYSGPPEGFAMVVPVPEVVKKEQVKTLSTALFTKVDTLAAPRLVEYWQQDPCAIPSAYGAGAPPKPRAVPHPSPSLGVKIEAQFEVGEYNIVVLSARDSSGLETWLKRNRYAIPDGAEPVLRGYVEQGTKFFVAKVDPRRVTFDGDRAVLSPLRIAYESKTFQLPIRLGMLNSKGDQDLLIHILAKDRYEVSNLPNLTIPTNLVVNASVKDDFGSFYEALFTNARADEPGAVITEYSWSASSCDPCPGPTLNPQDLTLLGTEVVGLNPRDVTLTRLHHRYDAKSGGEDLVFRKAKPLMGGSGTPNSEGLLPGETRTGSTNMFQGRYAILHAWPDEATCDTPNRTGWGGPPTGGTPKPLAVPGRLRAGMQAALPNLASVLGGASTTTPAPDPAPAPEPETTAEPSTICATTVGSAWLLILVLPLLRRRR